MLFGHFPNVFLPICSRIIPTQTSGTRFGGLHALPVIQKKNSAKMLTEIWSAEPNNKKSALASRILNPLELLKKRAWGSFMMPVTSC